MPWQVHRICRFAGLQACHTLNVRLCTLVIIAEHCAHDKKTFVSCRIVEVDIQGLLCSASRLRYKGVPLLENSGAAGPSGWLQDLLGRRGALHHPCADHHSFSCTQNGLISPVSQTLPCWCSGRLSLSSHWHLTPVEREDSSERGRTDHEHPEPQPVLRQLLFKSHF